MSKNKIKKHLEFLLYDCEVQVTALDQRNDVDWSPYEIANWQGMIQNINKCLEELNNE
jgi:hypothetical protein